ncbi:MAG TPA: hypothetical protein VI756_04330 [Blastocatellia bacterium]
MSRNQTNADFKDTQEQLNHNSAANSLSRRSFLGRAGVTSAVVEAASVGLPSSLLSENAEGQIADHAARAIAWSPFIALSSHL